MKRVIFRRIYCCSIAYIFQNMLFRCGWNCERTDFPPNFDNLLIGCGNRYFEQLLPVYISAELAWMTRSSNRCWRICCHRRTVTGRIHCSDIGSFLQISQKLREFSVYMYRKKFLGISISTTYLKITEIEGSLSTNWSSTAITSKPSKIDFNS